MIKCFVGDAYLIKKALEPLVKTSRESDDGLCYMESSTFGADEIGFLASFSFSMENKTLVFKTDKLEANDTLLDLLNEVETMEDNLFIVCNEIVKNRKLYNKLKAMNAIQVFELTPDMFDSICQETAAEYGAKITSAAILEIKKLSGYNYKEPLAVNDLVGFVKKASLLSKEITPELMQKIVPEHRNDDVWAMKDALIKGESERVMEIADTILSSKGGNAIGMLSAMVPDFRIAYKLSLFKDRKAEAEKALKTKRTPYGCAKFSPRQLCICLDTLTTGIQRMKSGYDSELELKVVLGKCLLALYPSFYK